MLVHFLHPSPTIRSLFRHQRQHCFKRRKPVPCSYRFIALMWPGVRLMINSSIFQDLKRHYMRCCLWWPSSSFCLYYVCMKSLESVWQILTLPRVHSRRGHDVTQQLSPRSFFRLEMINDYCDGYGAKLDLDKLTAMSLKSNSNVCFVYNV